MTTTNLDIDIEEMRDGLRRIAPPFLVRRYEATSEEYEQISDEDLRCEYLDGVLIVHSPATWNHEDRISFLIILLGSFAARRRIGKVVGSNSVMQLEERRFCPDVAFLKTEDLGRIKGGRAMGPLDLAVEMLSESTRAYDLGEKRAAYREGGVTEIWMIDPAAQEFHVDWRTREEAYQTQVLKEGRWSSRALPGFWLDVTWFWSDPLPETEECLRHIFTTPS